MELNNKPEYKEVIKQYMRDYFSKQENCICETCGGHYRYHQRTIHFKSKKHQKVNNPNVIDKRTHQYRNLNLDEH